MPVLPQLNFAPGDDRFYDVYIPIADRLYDDYLAEIRREGLIE